MSDTNKQGASRAKQNNTHQPHKPRTRTAAAPVDDVLTDAAPSDAVPADTVPLDETLFGATHVDAAPTDAPIPATEAPRLPRPRIRFGAIAWGLIVCAVAYVVLTTVSDADARAAFIDWLFIVEAGELVLLGVLAFGAFILLLALLGLIRRAQTAWGNRRR